ncbi:MAG TPA: valine--tRNA ligase, partial [Candidatus Bipolaricaulota bacterium]
MELPKTYDPQRAEDHWYAVWEERGYFHATVDAGKRPFAIVIPPPNVTGELHMGHALNNTLQDVIIRYHRADGKSACWFPGMDHASIAVHTLIERALAKRELDDLLRDIGFPVPAHTQPLTRRDLGREAFMKLGWAWKEKYDGRIRQQLRVLGCSCDWPRERFTMDEGLSHAVQTVFVRLYEEGLIYRDTRMVNWDVQAQTVLSDLEVENEENVQGELFQFAYPLEDGGELVVATTRPETMLGDTALAVHPDDARYKHLIGKFAVHPFLERRVPIIADGQLVDPAFGTGVVKVTPAHDYNDLATGKRHNLDVISILDFKGNANQNAGPFAGMERFQARRAVKEKLEELGLARGSKPHLMTLPRSQRTGTIVEPMLTTQWFVKMEPLARPAIEKVRDGSIDFIPQEWAKTYFHWMENIQDWCISRQLWWGHRIPVWYRKGQDPMDPRHWHVSTRPPDDAEHWEQDQDVLDTWFSSALWPFSIMDWPAPSAEQKYFYPTAFLSTGPDIIFFWVARMIMMGLHFMGEIPFRTVFFHPIVVDEHGKKMSKTKGNVIDPLTLKDEFGIDALRFTLVAGTAKGKDLRLSHSTVDGNRKFLNKIWNAARFVLSNLKGKAAPPLDQTGPLQLEDRWILSRLQDAVSQVRRALDRYDFNLAAGMVYSFIWRDYCDWYLEWVKPRLYASGTPDAVAQAVLCHVFDQILRLLHPFTPFIAEELWQHFPARAPESVMVAPFPQVQPALADSQAEGQMDRLQALITAIRTLRSELNVPPDRPATVLIRTEEAALEDLVRQHAHIFQSLAHAAQVDIGPQVTRPAQAPRKVLEFAEVFLPLEGVVDIAAERVRLVQELSRVESDLKRALLKLENEEFLRKAPTDVVDKEKRKLAEFQQMAQRLAENLELLGVKI